MDISDLTVELSSRRLKHVFSKTDLGFGRFFTDHMFTMDYTVEQNWHNPCIKPYAPMLIDPAAMVLHYGQGVFEGLKCYRVSDDKLSLFRPEDNFKRLNCSCEFLCMPKFDEVFVLEALKKLLLIEKNWVPTSPQSSLYIRPTIVATEPALGVRPANSYRFFIILSPVDAYYAEGIRPIKIKVAKDNVRVAHGSVGEAKTIGNYAAGLFPTVKAQKEGFTQVLWLDSLDRKYVEEVGVMNIFFLLGNELITPEFSGSILRGITRDSVIKLAKSWGIKVTERKIDINEIFDAYNKGVLKESFGTGTAVVISPIAKLQYDDRKITIGKGDVGDLSKKLFNHLIDIQYAKSENFMNWRVIV